MNLKELNCQFSSDFTRELSEAEKLKLKCELDSDWEFSSDLTKLVRKLKFKNFKKALHLVNQIGDIAEVERHHPDFHFGWGYCHIELTHHEKNNLTLNDFILASKIDEVLKRNL
jgi:4a-hydroxytetrahydrobiopterin dehydratase